MLEVQRQHRACVWRGGESESERDSERVKKKVGKERERVSD
jgi:hypothetical protein